MHACTHAHTLARKKTDRKSLPAVLGFPQHLCLPLRPPFVRPAQLFPFIWRAQMEGSGGGGETRGGRVCWVGWWGGGRQEVRRRQKAGNYWEMSRDLAVCIVNECVQSRTLASLFCFCRTRNAFARPHCGGYRKWRSDNHAEEAKAGADGSIAIALRDWGRVFQACGRPRISVRRPTAQYEFTL